MPGSLRALCPVRRGVTPGIRALCPVSAYAGTTIACAFVAVQTRFWPYVDPMDNKLKFVAEAQLFTTLLISIVLRTDNHTDALTRDQYGTILAVSFFAAPAVVIGSLLRVCTKWVRSKREGQD